MTRRLVFVAGVLMLAAAAATLVYRAVGPSDGTRTGYVTSALSSAGLAVAPLPGADTPLRSGDRVTAVDGVELERWLGRSVGDPLAATRGDSVAYSISRDGRTSEVEVPIGSYPLLETLIESWGTVLFCLVTLAVAAFVFARRPREPAAQALFVIGVSLTGSTIPWLLGFSALDLATGIGFWLWVVAAVAVYSVFWSSALHFTLIFPRRLAFVQRHPWVTALVYIGPLALFAGWALVGALTSPSVLDVLGSITALQLAFVLVDAGLLIALQVVQFRSAPTPVARDQARWLAWGGLMAIVLTVALWFGPQALTGEPLLPWSAIGLPGLFFTAAMAVAVLRHRLFDIDVVINRSLVYGALSVVVAAAYGVSVVVLRSVFGTDANLAVSLLSTGVAAVIALPVRDRIQRSVNRLMYGERDDPYAVLSRLSQQLKTTQVPTAVLPTIVEVVARTLKLPYVALALAHDTGFEVAAAHG
jgi:cbb3-type cytochrome oxidase subunit 3